jgi:hypothetical protein
VLLGGRGRIRDLYRHEQRFRLRQFLLPTEQNTRRYPIAPRHLDSENRSRPRPDETSVREMDAYRLHAKFPVTSKEFPVHLKIVPVSLRRELLDKWLLHSGFVLRNRFSTLQNRKIPGIMAQTPHVAFAP